MEILHADEVPLMGLAVRHVLLHELADVLHVGEDVAVAQAPLELLRREKAIPIHIQLRCSKNLETINKLRGLIMRLPP